MRWAYILLARYEDIVLPRDMLTVSRSVMWDVLHAHSPRCPAPACTLNLFNERYLLKGLLHLQPKITHLVSYQYRHTYSLMSP